MLGTSVRVKVHFTLTPLNIHATVPPRAWEFLRARIQFFPSFISSHTITPFMLLTIFLSSVPNILGLWAIYDKFGIPPLFCFMPWLLNYQDSTKLSLIAIFSMIIGIKCNICLNWHHFIKLRKSGLLENPSLFFYVFLHASFRSIALCYMYIIDTIIDTWNVYCSFLSANSIDLWCGSILSIFSTYCCIDLFWIGIYTLWPYFPESIVEIRSSAIISD